MSRIQTGKKTETKLVALIDDAMINCLNKHCFKASDLMDNSVFQTSKFIFLNIYLFILAAPGLSCGMHS